MPTVKYQSPSAETTLVLNHCGRAHVEGLGFEYQVTIAQFHSSSGSSHPPFRESDRGPSVDRNGTVRTQYQSSVNNNAGRGR